MDHSNHTTLLQAGGPTAVSDRMRDLLARAAQDHVYEQRTQGAVLDEIRQRLEGMEWLLREVRERELGGLSGSLETVNGRLDDMAAKPPMWAEGLAQHVEAVRDHVDAVGEHIGTVDSRVESVHQRVAPVTELPGLWAEIGNVGDNVDDVLKKLQAVLDTTEGVTRQVGDLGAKLNQLTGSMEAAAHRFTRIDRSLTDLTARADRVEVAVAELSDSHTAATEQVSIKVDAAEHRLGVRLDQLATGLGEAGRRLDGIDGRLGDVRDRAAATGESVSGLDTRLDGIDGKLGTVDGRLLDVDKHLMSVDNQIVGVDRRLGAVDGRLSRHDNRFDSLDGRIDGHLTKLDERLASADQHLTDGATRNEGRFNQLDGHLESLDERLGEATEHLTGRVEALRTRLSDADERLAAVNERLGELPGTLDAQGTDHGDRLTAAATALTELVEARPDLATLTETVTGIVEPATSDLTKRLGALEETMLALAEALLRPTRPKD